MTDLLLAQPSDLDLLVRHRRLMWEEIGVLAAGAPDPSEDIYRAWVGSKLNRTLIGIIAHDKGRILGSGILWFQETQPRPSVPHGIIPYLLSMYVEPHARHHGVARTITQVAIDRARADGYPRIALHASEAGRPLYESMGFAPSKELWLELGPATMIGPGKP